MRYSPHKEQEKLTNEQRAYNRLKQRKQDKPYYQRYYAIYFLVIIVGWSANILSGVTESSKLYAFYYEFLRSFTFAESITWFGVVVSVALLEVLHRLIASSYFKDLVENDIHTQAMTPKLVAMLSLAVISVALSFAGSFDLVRLTKQAPTPLIADKISISELSSAYQPLVNDVKTDIAEYRSTREWKGRLSDDSAKKWEDMKANKQDLQQQQAEALKNLSATNLQLEIRTDSLNQQRHQQHESQMQEKGYGLGFLSIAAIFVLYACLWYDEEYQERKALYLEQKFGAMNTPVSNSILNQPIEPHTAPKANGQPLPYPTDAKPTLNGQKNGAMNHQLSPPNPIGFFTALQRAEMELTPTLNRKTSVQACTGLYREDSPQHETGIITPQKVINDPHTIEHQYQKGGKTHTVRYNLLMINSRIGQYEREVSQAKRQKMDAAILQNRQNWLRYWQGKRGELLQKMP
ncbi:MAG: hypothetical protein AAF731_06020 [Bacteroidota bacterium]